MEMIVQPLQGIRVLDLSVYPPGDLCTMMLSDFGADVIKVEAPTRSGRRTADEALSRPDVDEEILAAYYGLNRNKRSIILNLKTEEGLKIFYRFAEGADVIFEGFRPGVVKRLKVDYEELKKRNHSLIYCSLSGYGQDGPYKDLPGHDINYMSTAGILALNGRQGDKPIIPLNLVADFAGGSLCGVIGILLALFAREKTGEGQYVDVSMTDGAVSLMALEAAEYFRTGIVPSRGSLSVYHSPYYDIYETKDQKLISIGAIEPQFWERLCHVIGRDDLIPL